MSRGMARALVFSIVVTGCVLPLHAQQTDATAIAPRPLVGIDLSKTMHFQFDNVTVGNILAAMSEQLGFVVISGQLPSARVTVQGRSEVGPADAISRLNEILTPMGYVALVSHTYPNEEKGEKGSTILRIVTIAGNTRAQIPVYQSANPHLIPMSDELRTQIIPVETISAVGLLNDLRPLISGEITASPGANAIIITDTAARIQRVVQIIWALDHAKRPANVLQYRRLVNSSAVEAAQLVNSIFSQINGNAQTQGLRGAAATSGPAIGFAGPGRGAGAGGNSIAPRLYADADARTNMVILSGPDEDVRMALDLINRLEAVPPGELNSTVMLVQRLRYADSASLAAALNQIFGNGNAGTVATATPNNSLTVTRGNTLGSAGGTTRGGSGATSGRGTLQR